MIYTDKEIKIIITVFDDIFKKRQQFYKHIFFKESNGFLRVDKKNYYVFHVCTPEKFLKKVKELKERNYLDLVEMYSTNSYDSYDLKKNKCIKCHEKFSNKTIIFLKLFLLRYKIK